MIKVFYNSRIYTIDDMQPIADYMIVENGIIKEIGTGLNKRMFSEEELVDMQDAALVPGLIDSHLHACHFARYYDCINLSNIKTVQEAVSMLKEQLINFSGKGWIKGYLWDDSFQDNGEGLDRHWLDRVSDTVPVYVRRVCGHVHIVNTAAIKLAGIDNMPDPPGGIIERDEKGNPTGVLKDNAFIYISDVMPEFTVNDYKKIIPGFFKLANSLGITSVQSVETLMKSGLHWKDIWNMYSELEASGAITVRYYMQAETSSLDEVDCIIKNGYKTTFGSAFVKQGCIKMYMDGSLGGDTAWLLQPYSHKPEETGMNCLETEELDKMILAAHAAGIQTAVHAIGDRAVLLTLEAIEKAQAKYPGTNMRHRVVHCQVLDDRIIKYMKRLGVIADIQPVFLSDDLKWIEKKLGTERSRLAYGWKSIIDSGIIAAGGSDYPISGLNPFSGIYSGVSRKDFDGFPKGGFMPHQKLDLLQTLKLYTINAAYASFEEDIKGTLSPGKVADFIVLDKDPFKEPADNLKNIKVIQTYISGRRVF